MFAGILSRFASSLEVNEAELISALDPFDSSAHKGSFRRDAIILAQTSGCNTQPRCEIIPYRCSYSGLVIVSWARIDNRGDLLSRLDLPEEATDPRLILEAFRRWGEDCVLHLVGDFSFAIADPEKNSLFLARDPMGVRPLYYWSHPQFFAFGTSAAVFLSLKQKPEPATEWMALYLADMSWSYTATAYKEVLKLAPGHSLTIEGGKEKLQRYFYFRDDAPIASRRSENWVEEYRKKLEEAVRCRLQSDHPVGCESSGGIDSSSIVGIAAKFLQQPKNIHCFGSALNDLEPEYILGTSRHCGVTNNHIVTMRHNVEEAVLLHFLQVTGYPAEHGSSTNQNLFHQWCRQFNIHTLFSGFGGDEIVSNTGRHLRYELLLNRQYKALWENLPGNPLMRSLRYAKAVKNYLRPPEFNAQLHSALSARLSFFILRKEVIERFSISKQYTGLARWDAPYQRINDFILQREISPVIATRLENCSLMAKSYGIDYCWPLLDTRLIQQYLSTPAIEKASAKWGRYLHRRAIEGLVPPKVQWHSGGMGESHGDVRGHKQRIMIAKEEDANLHPEIAELIDRKKFRQQIALAEKENLNMEFFVQFRDNVNKVRWLNRWLHGGKL